jgi:hypothetical protein
MAHTFTEGYRLGFIANRLDLSRKSIVNIRYQIGFERILRYAVGYFKEMGLEPAIYRAAYNAVNKRQHLKIGYHATSPNKQYDYDHRFDIGLFFDKAFKEKKLECLKYSLELYKEKAGQYLLLLSQKAQHEGGRVLDIGTYKGFNLKLEYSPYFSIAKLRLNGAYQHTVELGGNSLGNLQRIDNALESMETQMQRYENQLAQLSQDLETAKEEYDKPWRFEEEYKSKLARQAELNVELDLNKRDEVIGEWVSKGDDYLFCVYLYIDGQNPMNTAIRDMVFRRELPLALETIRYGDRSFFTAHPKLDYSRIIVHFMSTNHRYNKIEDWGNFSDYKVNLPDSTSQAFSFSEPTYLLDMKFGDVNGDGVPDQVSLYGNKPGGATGLFADNITLIIEDGRTHQKTTATPVYNSGYNARLFLGDFTQDQIDDIKVSIDTGGSGGYGFFYLYSFADNNLKEIFDFNVYNQSYRYRVDYADFYKVNVASITLDKLFVLDISYKGTDYLSEFYDVTGKLKQPVQGEVLAVSALDPIVNDEKNNTYDLLAFQRIIGTTNSDTLGYIENLLTWDGQKFSSARMMAAIPGTTLISTY